jgi:hypothetical protein
MLITGAMVTMAGQLPAQAQQMSVSQAPRPAADASAQDPAKPSVMMFELGLQRAIEAGGAKFAQQALQAVPGLLLQPSSEPIVRGYPVPEYGFAFEVQIPMILDSGMQLLTMRSVRPPLASAAQAQGVRVGSAGTTTAAAGTVAADPMTASPVLDNFSSEAAANAFYTSCVKEALIDAMIDNSVALPLNEKATLLLVVSGMERMSANPLYRTRERRLILTVKSADLTEFRAGKLPREQVKERIAELRW